MFSFFSTKSNMKKHCQNLTFSWRKFTVGSISHDVILFVLWWFSLLFHYSVVRRLWRKAAHYVRKLLKACHQYIVWRAVWVKQYWLTISNKWIPILIAHYMRMKHRQFTNNLIYRSLFPIQYSRRFRLLIGFCLMFSLFFDSAFCASRNFRMSTRFIWFFRFIIIKLVRPPKQPYFSIGRLIVFEHLHQL